MQRPTVLLDTPYRQLQVRCLCCLLLSYLMYVSVVLICFYVDVFDIAVCFTKIMRPIVRPREISRPLSRI